MSLSFFFSPPFWNVGLPQVLLVFLYCVSEWFSSISVILCAVLQDSGVDGVAASPTALHGQLLQLQGQLAEAQQQLQLSQSKVSSQLHADLWEAEHPGLLDVHPSAVLLLPVPCHLHLMAVHHSLTVMHAISQTSLTQCCILV